MAASWYLESFAGAELRQFDLLHTELAIAGVAPAKASSSKAPAEPKAEKKKEEVVAKAEEAPAPAAPAKKEEAKPEADEDDIDLFGSDDDLDEEAEKVKAARVAEYEAKKSNKPAVIAKSQVILDVKPWDDETGVLLLAVRAGVGYMLKGHLLSSDMDELTKGVKAIEMPGLIWGAHKLVAVGYGIKKLQITVGRQMFRTTSLEITHSVAPTVRCRRRPGLDR
jgi:translation elongation factor EF-1beta